VNLFIDFLFGYFVLFSLLKIVLRGVKGREGEHGFWIIFGKLFCYILYCS
jgi:hypothetical protein